MMAPTTFTQTNGMLICIDAFDVCKVNELDNGFVKVTFMATDEKEDFQTALRFADVVAAFAKARKQAHSNDNHDDDWGNDDTF